MSAANARIYVRESVSPEGPTPPGGIVHDPVGKGNSPIVDSGRVRLVDGCLRG